MELQLQSLFADKPLERRDPRFVLLHHVGGGNVLVEAAGLVLQDPDPDQVAREVVAFGQTMHRLAA